MYKKLDKTLPTINKRFIREFAKIKHMVDFDELNVILASRTLYSTIDRQAREYFLRLAQETYDGDTITQMWIMGFLNLYNPVTKYVYTHEVDRKRARLAESVIASETKAEEVDVALRYWSQMVRQYGVDVIDAAIIQSYKDRGYTKVVWNTEEDSRVCNDCLNREGRVYDIDDLPAKPHWGCRCYYTLYKGK